MRCGSTCLVSLHLDKEDWTWGEKGVGGSRWCGEISLKNSLDFFVVVRFGYY